MITTYLRKTICTILLTCFMLNLASPAYASETVNPSSATEQIELKAATNVKITEQNGHYILSFYSEVAAYTEINLFKDGNHFSGPWYQPVKAGETFSVDLTDVMSEKGRYYFDVTSYSDENLNANERVISNISNTVTVGLSLLKPVTNLSLKAEGTQYIASFYSEVDAYVSLYIYKDGYRYSNTPLDMPVKAGSTVRNDLSGWISESGTYYFDCISYRDDKKMDDDYKISDTSNMLKIEVSKKQLSVPSNLRWSKSKSGTAEWGKVENASSYSVTLFKDGVPIVTLGTENTYIDFLGEMGGDSNHKFTFTVKANSYNLASYLHSDTSGQSPVLELKKNEEQENPTVSSDVAAQLKDSNAAIANTSSSSEAKRIVDNIIKNTNTRDLLLAVQTDSSTRRALYELEKQYQRAANVTVVTTVASETKLDRSKVSVQGAALNTAPDTSVFLNVKLPASTDVKPIDTSIYTSVLQLDMDIINNDTLRSITRSDGTLDIPVTVTLPVPAGMRAENMRILHYHHSDNGFDIIIPRINADGTISFTISHFSIFAFAEIKDNDTEKNEDPKTDPKNDTPESQLPFNDVSSGSWYYDAVRFAYNKGLMNGTGSSLFSPELPTSRAMIVTIIHRMEGTPRANAPAAFSDVKNGEYFAEAVSWAAENNIVTGYSSTVFDPNGDVTREQMAAILRRYARFKGKDVSASTSLSGFTDANSISSYATEDVAYAVAVKLMKGKGNDSLAPTANATRAEVATLFMNFDQNIMR